MDTKQARIAELGAENAALKEELKNANNRSFCATEAHVAAQQEIAALKKRLEVSNEYGWDGIACRDETIRIAEKQLLTAQHRIKRLQKELKFLYQRYAGTDNPTSLATPFATPELDALVRDAARYRFIRDVPYTDDIKRTIRLQLNEIMDERIDAAMKETPK